MSRLAKEVRICLTLLAAASILSHVDAQEPSVITNSLGMKLVLIPAGEFMMGSVASEAERELQESQHQVVISRPFYMGAYEVTQGQYARLMGNDRKTKAFFDEAHGGSPDHPIEYVTRQGVTGFCKALSALPEERQSGRHYRLPTEAEWEYACRAGESTPFHFGASLSSRQANFNGSVPFFGAEPGPYLKATIKVGSYSPNAWGLYDMHGNVAEICADWYARDAYAESPPQDPAGPPEGASFDNFGNTYFVVRGGCWLDDARACRSAYRFRAMKKNRYPQYGFRVVCDIPAPSDSP